MGRGIIEAGLFRTERVELETRTSDPPSPADGERWLRTDLSDTANDKLAELRWYDGSDGSAINRIDVVAPGTTDSGVQEFLRVETPDGTGAIPAISPPGDAKYSSQRARHAGADYGLGVLNVPDSVVTQYTLDDDGTTSTATDSVGTNDANISGASYTTTANVGSHALSFGGSDELSSQSAVDLVADGANDAMSVMAWVYPRNTDQRSPVGWWANRDNMFYVYNDGSNWRFIHTINGSSTTATGSAINTGSWTHLYLESTQSEAILKVDGSADAAASHGDDITGFGAMRLRSSHDPYGNNSDCIIDDYHAANDTLSDSELQSVIDRAN